MFEVAGSVDQWSKGLDQNKAIFEGRKRIICD